MPEEEKEIDAYGKSSVASVLSLYDRSLSERRSRWRHLMWEAHPLAGREGATEVSGGEERGGNGCSKVSPTKSVGLTMVIARRSPNLLRDLEMRKRAMDRGPNAGPVYHQDA
jgi:hypothetical protein